MKKNHIQQGNYTKLSGFRQVVLSLDYGFQIGPKEPVRLLDAVLEELDYTQVALRHNGTAVRDGRFNKGTA